MTDELARLTEREKAVLRLLARGHDAKSAAQALGLSVHTVNERLRDARRALGASSSREAARALAEAEGGQENWAKEIRLDGDPVAAANVEARGRHGRTRRRTVLLLIGAVLMLSAAVALLIHLHAAPDDAAPQAAEPTAAAPAPIYLLSFDIAAPGVPPVRPRLSVRAGEMSALARAGMGRPDFEISVVATPDPQHADHVVLAMNIVSPTERSLRAMRRVSLRFGEQSQVELRDDHDGTLVLTLSVSAQPVAG